MMLHPSMNPGRSPVHKIELTITLAELLQFARTFKNWTDKEGSMQQLNCSASLMAEFICVKTGRPIYFGDLLVSMSEDETSPYQLESVAK